MEPNPRAAEGIVVRDAAVGVLACALASACAGGVPIDDASPFGSGGEGPVAQETGDTGEQEEPDAASEGGDESTVTTADPLEATEGSLESSTTADAETGNGANCLPTTADCDGDGLCEADLTAAATCGACDKSCVLPGATLACNAGMCEGVVAIVDVADTYIDDDDDDDNFGSAAHLLVVDDADTDIGLIKPNDLGGIPVGATVLSAELVLTCTTVGSPMTVTEIASPWDEATVTWNARPQATTQLGTHATAAGPNLIPITAVAQAWVDAGAPGHGVQLATNGEAENMFASGEHPTPTDHPRFELTISY
jgi:hypothetical protein